MIQNSGDSDNTRQNSGDSDNTRSLFQLVKTMSARPSSTQPELTSFAAFPVDPIISKVTLRVLSDAFQCSVVSVPLDVQATRARCNQRRRMRGNESN